LSAKAATFPTSVAQRGPRFVTRLAIALHLFLLAGLAVPHHSHAQVDRRGGALRIVPGVAYAGASLDQNRPTFDETAVFTWGAQVWGGLSRSVGFQAELIWQPTNVSNPPIQQAFSALYLMGGPEFSLGQIYVRPSVGVVWLYFDGNLAKEDSDNAFAFGLAIGSERKVDKGFHLAPELLTRMSVESGLFTWMVGVQMGLGWRSNPY